MMCLLVFAYQRVPDVPIILAANREESAVRPSLEPNVVLETDGTCWFGGRDGVAGGTWLGVNQTGLAVGVTNRSDRPAPPRPRSRGLLCRALLKCAGFADAVEELDRQLDRSDFTGFNLLLISRDESLVLEYGVRTRRCELTAGLHVLTNAGLDDANNPRAEHARREFRTALDEGGSLPAMIAVAKDVCRSTELELHSGGDAPPWGTVSASVIALPDDPAAAQFHYAAGPPTRTAFASYSNPLREMLRGAPSTSLHRIRLKGPWEFEWLGGPPIAAPATGRVTMPADWETLFGATAGRAVFRRRFHCPTNLEPDDRVWLVFDGVGGEGTVAINGEFVGRLQTSEQPQRLDVADRLQPFNEATVELAFDPAADANPGGLYAPVAIEIESDHE